MGLLTCSAKIGGGFVAKQMAKTLDFDFDFDDLADDMVPISASAKSASPPIKQISTPAPVASVERPVEMMKPAMPSLAKQQETSAVSAVAGKTMAEKSGLAPIDFDDFFSDAVKCAGA